ncbi:sensor histidine kinase [Halopenitus sp. H-Gu1]|uniref:sensor histidine kinase n=1 Tax=Halopenitus sp. H-Gu1 TaxID=3242697 RepID=UPI00359CBAF4
MSSREDRDGGSDESSNSETNFRYKEELTSDSDDHKFSPTRMLTYLVLVIFVAEVIVMGLLHAMVRDLHPATEALVDSTALLLLIFPVLYLTLFRPMNRTIDHLQTQKEALKSFKRTINQTEEQRNNLEILNQVLRHDIRNDIQLITAYADMLETYVDDEEGIEHLRTINEVSDDVIALTATAGDLADVMLGTHVENDQIQLNSVTKEELTEARQANTNAEIRVDGGLPNTEVRANSLLNSVFRNLLTNAIRHNDKDKPEITLSAEENDDTVRVRVADNGPGVPDARKDDIFGQGEKGLESPGTGVGLYLVNTLVDTYGGDVWVEDNEPEGAVFVVELPVTEDCKQTGSR